MNALGSPRASDRALPAPGLRLSIPIRTCGSRRDSKQEQFAVALSVWICAGGRGASPVGANGLPARFATPRYYCWLVV